MLGDRFKVITVESDFGAGKKGAAFGPQALLNELQQKKIDYLDVFNYIRLVPKEMPSSAETPFGKNIENISNFQSKVCQNIGDILRLHKIPFIISGDHSSANALVSGIKDFHPNRRIGVIWIDAHADLHSPYTTPSGNIHGMPLAALMGDDHRESAKNEPREITKKLWDGLKKLGRKRISPKIQGDDLVYIGLRSTELEEERIITKENIMAYRPDMIRTEGIEVVARKALEHLRFCEYIYISFDVDSLDSNISMGTGTPVEDGLSLEEAEYLLRLFIRLPNLAGFEITEINPVLDVYKPMHQIVGKLLGRVFYEPGQPASGLR